MEAGSRACESGAAMVTLASNGRCNLHHEECPSHGCWLLMFRETDVIPQHVQHVDLVARMSGQHLCLEKGAVGRCWCGWLLRPASESLSANESMSLPFSLWRDEVESNACSSACILASLALASSSSS